MKGCKSYIRKKWGGKITKITLVIATMVLLSACGSKSSQGDAQTAKTVNIGITSSLGSVNPFMMDQTEVNKYTVDLMFLPLVELDKHSNFEGMLADSIKTEDSIHFTIHINDKAKWSDGKPVTAEDLAYSIRMMASPVIANATYMLYSFEGTDDAGFVESGSDSMSGLTVVNEKTLQITAKYPLSLTSFQNMYGRYLRALPKHVLEKYSDEEIMTLDWFNHPDVVNGPYILTDYDADHFITFTANKGYWKGTPNVDNLNMKIVDGSQIYAGLQSGEIDITQMTMTAIPESDYESIEALDTVTAVFGAPVTNQSVFIQTANLTDKRIRKALVYAIDRQLLVNQMLKGHGEVIDGFVSSASPYYDDDVEPIQYNPDKARELLQEAGWDGSRTLRFYVWSGDSTFVNAAQLIVAQWAEVGVKAEITTMDLANLMTVAGGTDYDLLAVQYTYAPVDPYPDVAWLLGGEGSWTSYTNKEVNAALEHTQGQVDLRDVTDDYTFVDTKMQEDVPMFSAYVISQMGAVSKRLIGAEPTVYGFFNHVEKWDVAK